MQLMPNSGRKNNNLRTPTIYSWTSTKESVDNKTILMKPIRIRIQAIMELIMLQMRTITNNKVQMDNTGRSTCSFNNK